MQTLGVDPADHSTQRWLRTRIGVVLQELAIEPYYSVRQVLTRNAGYYPNPRPVDEVIELIGLGEKADDRVKRLSGGQQRRLDVGLGIIGNPDLLFLDEPTTGLDPSGRRDTWDLIRRLAAGRDHGAADDALHGRGGGAGRPGGRAVRPGDRGQRHAVVHRRARPRRGDHPLPPARRRGARRAARSGPSRPDDGHVEIHTEDELRVLHDLTGWALDGGHPLAGLSVLRVSLEDIYLGLTRSGAERRTEGSDGAGGVGAVSECRHAGQGIVPRRERPAAGGAPGAASSSSRSGSTRSAR